MDPVDLNTWKLEWEAFKAAPYLYVLALVLGWWIGKTRADAKVNGLEGTISNLKSKIELLKERLDYVNDRERDVRRANAELEKEREELKARIAANAPKEDVVIAAENVDAAITKASTANNALSVALTTLDLTTGAPEIGTPELSTTKKSE